MAKVSPSYDALEAVIARLERIERRMATIATSTPVPLPQAGADAVSVDANDFVSFTTGSTSFTATGGFWCATPFLAPQSGKVLICTNAQCVNSIQGGYTGVAPQVMEGPVFGAGDVVLAAGFEHAVTNQSAIAQGGDQRAGVTKLLPGLIPGVEYHVELHHAVTAGIGTINFRTVIVVPLER